MDPFIILMEPGLVGTAPLVLAQRSRRDKCVFGRTLLVAYLQALARLDETNYQSFLCPVCQSHDLDLKEMYRKTGHPGMLVVVDHLPMRHGCHPMGVRDVSQLFRVDWLRLCYAVARHGRCQECLTYGRLSRCDGCQTFASGKKKAAQRLQPLLPLLCFVGAAPGQVRGVVLSLMY